MVLRRVKILAQLAGRTQADVARAVRVQPPTLSLVVNGHQEAWSSLRTRLAAELGVSEEWLFAEGPVDPRDLPSASELAAREGISVEAATSRLEPVLAAELRLAEVAS